MILGIDASQANRKVRSGTEWYSFYLIQEFKKLLAGREDVAVRLYLRDSPQPDLVDDLPENFSAQGGPASGWEVRILRWPFKYLWTQIRLSWEMLVNAPDVLFCPAHTIPIWHPKKIFTTLHDIGFEDYPELYDKLSLWYHKFSARLAVKKATHIFTVSEFSKKRIVEVYGCPEEKISVTYLGINPENFQFSISNFQSKSKFLIPNSYILFLGRLEPKKNILNIVRAYEQTRVDLPLVLAGRQVRVDDIERYLEDRPQLKSKIKFLGYVSQQDKWDLYRGARLFLFPTLYEGFGLPILEAQAAGAPVITSNRASNPEIAGGAAIVVNPEDIEEIARAMVNLLEDESLRKELIFKGRENLKRFDWTRTADETLKHIFAV